MRLTGSSIVSGAGAAMLAATVLLAVEAHAQSSGDGISNFLGNIFSGPKSETPAQPQAAPGDAPPWSGEDGASGHPLMTASAIRDAAANFNHCVSPMWPYAARRDISQDSFQRFTAGLE